MASLGGAKGKSDLFFENIIGKTEKRKMAEWFEREQTFLIIRERRKFYTKDVRCIHI